MKTIISCLSTLLIATSFVIAQTDKTPENKIDSSKMPVMTFEVTTHDFGTIEHSGNGTYEFEFKNTGKTNLILTDVRTSCGCTTPNWTKEPIEKGKKGSIKVTYDTKRVGPFTKTITVISNAKNSPVTLTIKGTVKPAAPVNQPDQQTTSPTQSK